MITVRLIQDLVCEKFKISRDQLLDDDRHIKFARPRQVAMILAREMTGMSLPALGMAFCRDHTTILYAIRKRNKIEAIPRYAQGMAEIHAELMAPAEAASRLAELKMRKAWKAAIPSHLRREAA